MPVDPSLPPWLRRFAPLPASAFDDFEAYARHITGWTGVLACGGGALLVLLWWPSDGLLPVDAAVRAALRRWRLWMVGLGCLGAVLTWAQWRRQRDTALVQGAFYGAAIVASFSTFSSVGGPGTPWPYAGPLVPLATLLLLVPLRRRIALALSAWVLVELSYYGPNPDWMDDPYALNAAILTLTAAGFSVVVGHLLYVLSRRNFTQQQALTRLASIDGLTGALNRRAFLARCREELHRAGRNRRPLCLVMLDLDHFKRINDTRGHAVGDLVLREAAARLRQRMRESDVLGRLGGEEFAVLLPETGLAEAREVAERLRRVLADSPIRARGVEVAITASFGVAPVDAADDDGVERALQDADTALYRAKEAGRNRVVPHEPPHTLAEE
ncbi:MAG: GGDEF domain-containing protein [Deltaproteobacteria bacterium]|nr:MAG: GGDEF domain-containing protein [Deltaproteobacteria bacterium]